MEQQHLVSRNTPAWRIQVWVSFILSMGLSIIGIYNLPVDWWVKGYFLMGTVFLVASCFGLAKTLRDDQELDKLVTRVSEAKMSKIIKEYED